MKSLFLIFLAVPLAEIYLLIEVGSAIGAVTTIFLVVLTALLGAVLVRLQGFSTLSRARAEVAQGRAPALEILEGVCLFVAGALLLTPGFFTDAVGFALLTPPLRRRIVRHVLERRMLHAAARSGRVIDVEYRDLD